MFARVITGTTLIVVAAMGSWSAHLSDAASLPHGLPACTVTLPSGSTNTAVLQLSSSEVLCVSGVFTNKHTIAVASGTAVIESSHFVNDGLVSAADGADLQFTSLPTNLQGTTLTGGQWMAAGVISLPGAISTVAANVTLSGGGEIEDSTNSENAVDSLTTITKSAVFTLNDSAYLGTGSVTSAGTIILGTKGNSGDSVNWQDSGTFTMTGGSFTFLDPNACINAGSRAFTITGGTMSGFGMLTGTTTVSGTAVFAPTLNGGQAAFALAGSYTQTGGTFEDTVTNQGGSATTGSLSVGGAVTLGGTLQVMSTGSKPATGSAFQIIGAASVSGQFKSVRNMGVAGFSERTVTPNASIVTMASSPPSAPRSVHASVKRSGSAKISWSVPASNGGEAVTRYIVVPHPTCSCKGLSAGAKASQSTVSGLKAGTRYTFSVEAANSVGTGIASKSTGSVKG